MNYILVDGNGMAIIGRDSRLMKFRTEERAKIHADMANNAWRSVETPVTVRKRVPSGLYQ